MELREWIIFHQGCCRKFVASNYSSVPKYVHISKAGPTTLEISGQYIKIQCLMYHTPIKILKHHASPNSSYQNSKICISKVQKNLSKINDSKTLIFHRRYHVSLWVFASNSRCFSCWNSIAKFKVLQVKWCQVPLKHLSWLEYYFSYALRLQITNVG